MNGFHECELKFYIDRCKISEDFIEILCNRGYKEKEERLETDYIFDTFTEILKKEKILLRVRSLVTKDAEEIYFTLKIKGGSSSFQDSIEFETNTSNFNQDMAKNIIDIVYDRTGISLSFSVFQLNSINDILSSFSAVGFIPSNIVQKKRREYTGINAKILFDRFPKIQGYFIEIEADSENRLFESLKELGLDILQSDKRNYGQIIAEMTGNEKILIFGE